MSVILTSSASTDNLNTTLHVHRKEYDLDFEAVCSRVELGVKSITSVESDTYVIIRDKGQTSDGRRYSYVTLRDEARNYQISLDVFESVTKPSS